MLLVASATGHVYTFATPKLQPMVSSESGKAFIQACLSTPDSDIAPIPTRMRKLSTGFEECDLRYGSEFEDEPGKPVSCEAHLGSILYNSFTAKASGRI